MIVDIDNRHRVTGIGACGSLLLLPGHKRSEEIARNIMECPKAKGHEMGVLGGVRYWGGGGGHDGTDQFLPRCNCVGPRWRSAANHYKRPYWSVRIGPLRFGIVPLNARSI